MVQLQNPYSVLMVEKMPRKKQRPNGFIMDLY